MPPVVALTAWATPPPPLAAWNVVGHLIVELLPSFQEEATASIRNSEKFCVVPEESERTTGAIGVAGRFALAFSALIAGSFQVLMVPWKIPARVGASSWRLLTPGRL